MLTITTILFSTLVILFLSICANILLFLIIKAGLAREEQLKEIIIELKGDFDKCLIDITDIDQRGMFESDDEVGAIFKGIKDVINKTNEKINR